MASGLALAWERPMGHSGVSWADARYLRVYQGLLPGNLEQYLAQEKQ